MKRKAASLKIQTSLRGLLARKNYTSLKYSVVVLQTGIRAMAAHKEFKYKNQTKAATIIQVADCVLLVKISRLIDVLSLTKMIFSGSLARS